MNDALEFNCLYYAQYEKSLWLHSINTFPTAKFFISFDIQSNFIKNFSSFAI